MFLLDLDTVSKYPTYISSNNNEFRPHYLQERLVNLLSDAASGFGVQAVGWSRVLRQSGERFRPVFF